MTNTIAMRLQGLFAGLACAAVAAPCGAAPLPPAVRTMIETAIRGQDAATIAAVIAVAKKAEPDSLSDIQALEAGYRHQLELAKAEKLRAARERLAKAGPLALWTGELELGGSRATGSAETASLFGAAKLTREGLHWTHKLSARADYGESSHKPTAARFVAAYQPQLKLDPRSYVYGLTEYEHDRFLGYRDRYTLGLGLGTKAIDRPGLGVAFDVGPAIRYARYYDRATEDQLAARGAMTAKWTLRPDLSLSEEAALYLDRLHTTGRSTLALNMKLLGPIKGRISYDVQYERDAPAGRRQSDAVTRATLAYGF